MKNARTQFEIKSMYGRNLIVEYYWCVNNLPLKEDRGIVYQVDEIFIITSRDSILRKINKHFNSSFAFSNNPQDRIFYLL